MTDFISRIALVLFMFMFVPFLIGAFILTVMAYLAALDWVWVALQAWWMA